MPHTRERVLPTGTMELVINLHEDVIRSYDNDDPTRFETHPGSVIAGTRSEFMIIDTESQESIMGVAFKPGGAFPFLGVPACEVHGGDVALDALWGSYAAELRWRLMEAPTPAAKFAVLESALLERMSGRLDLHPAVRHALRELKCVPHMRTLAQVTADVGLSQRRFIQLFREQVGMPPKLYYRIQRFQAALHRIEDGRRVEWADLALDCGYYDQAHFIRDFRAFSGINPSTYLIQRADRLNHVPLFI